MKHRFIAASLALAGGGACAQQAPDNAASAPQALPEVRAVAAPESAAGPVRGYAARRSAAATKTDTATLEAPQSVSVIGREQLDTQAPVSVTEALRYSAGVITEQWGQDYRNDQFLLRGFEAGTAGGLFKDGLPLKLYNHSGWRLEPYGIERIDVLRGPASVLYGTATPGGLVMVTAKRPTAERFGEIGLSLGSFSRRQLELDLGGPLGAAANGDAASDWRYRLTGVARDSGTQTDFTPDDRLFLAPALTWQPSARTSLTLLAHLQRDRTNSSAYLPAAGTRDPNPNGRLPTSRYTGDAGNHYDQDQASLGWALEHRLDEAWTLRQNARVGRIELDYDTVYMSGFVTGADGVPVDYRTVNRFRYGVDEQTDSASIDTQAQWQGRLAGLRHTLLAGLDLLRDRQSGAAVFGVGSTLDVYAPVYGSPGPAPALFRDQTDRLAQTGLYLQDQIYFGAPGTNGRERWVATLGLRHDRSRATTDDRLADADVDQRDRATTGRAGLVYLADNGLAPYASFSTAFNPVLGRTWEGTPFVPERSRQIEAGLRWQPDGRRLSASAALFRIDKRNALTADSDPAHPGARVQTGEVRSQGLELEAQGEIAPGWRAITAYTFTDLEVTRSNDGNLGKSPERVPRHQASAWLEHQRRAGAALLGVGGGLRHTGKTWSDAANTSSLPGVTLVDAGGWLELGAWRAALNIANLADKAYPAICYGSGADTICSYGSVRRVTASLRYRW